MPTASNAKAEQLPKADAAPLAAADQEVPDPGPGLFCSPSICTLPVLPERCAKDRQQKKLLRKGHSAFPTTGHTFPHSVSCVCPLDGRSL